jgi:hypothetical protein
MWPSRAGPLGRCQTPARRQPADLHITSGPAHPPGHCQGRVDTKRPQRQVENDEYAAFARRVLQAYARRVGNGDVEALILPTSLAEEIDTAIARAVNGLRAFGYSWAEIGSRLGITRQAAQKRWEATS